MHFDTEKAIYLQIADHVMEKILKEEFLAEQKILSVRDLAGELEVNPNTVMRAYDLLQQQEIIYNRRGLGFFVAKGAQKTVTKMKKKHFIDVELPQFFNTLDLLDINMEEVNTYYKKRN